MSLFGVTAEKESELREQMQVAGLREEDLVEKFVRSSGHGGQNVNKTATCVYLKHVPSGIEVKISRERSQGLNRFFARRRLLERYRAEVLGQVTEADKRREKLRKQKKRRYRRSLSAPDSEQH